MMPTAMLVRANAMSKLVQRPEPGEAECVCARGDSMGADGASASGLSIVGSIKAEGRM